jgi:hypothetical protein
MATTVEYWLYQGDLKTPDGKAYSNAQLIATFKDKRTKTIFVESNGEFYINFKFKERLPLDPLANPGKLDALDVDKIQSSLDKLEIIKSLEKTQQNLSNKFSVPDNSPIINVVNSFVVEQNLQLRTEMPDWWIEKAIG